MVFRHDDGAAGGALHHTQDDSQLLDSKGAPKKPSEHRKGISYYLRSTNA